MSKTLTWNSIEPEAKYLKTHGQVQTPQRSRRERGEKLGRSAHLARCHTHLPSCTHSPKQGSLGPQGLEVGAAGAAMILPVGMGHKTWPS